MRSALTDRIGLKKTTQNIKHLEMASGPLYDVPSDPHPQRKCARNRTPHPKHNEDVVSLGWSSEDDYDIFMEESVDTALNTTNAKASGSRDTHRYVGGFSMFDITNTTHIVTEKSTKPLPQKGSLGLKTALVVK